MQLFRTTYTASIVIIVPMIVVIIFISFEDVLYAQLKEDNTAPIIVHLPIKAAIRGQAISVIARVAEDSEVGSVTVKFKKGKKFLDVPLPMIKTAESGVVKIKIISEAAYVFSGPGMYNDTLATVIQDEVYETFEEEAEHSFYHIRLAE